MGSAVDLTDVTTSDAGVLVVAGFEGNDVRLTGVAPGTARVNLEAGDKSDSFELEVRDEAGSTFRVIQSDADDTILTRVRETAQLRVPAGTSVLIDQHYYVDAQGNALSGGGGSIAWTGATGTGVTLTPDESGYRVAVTTEAEGGTGAINSPWSATPLRVNASDVADPAAFEPYLSPTLGSATIDGNVITFSPGALVGVTFDVLDSDGRVHVGDWGFNGSIEVSDNGANRVMMEASCDHNLDGAGCIGFDNVGLFRVMVTASDKAEDVDVKLRLGDLEEDWVLRFQAR